MRKTKLYCCFVALLLGSAPVVAHAEGYAVDASPIGLGKWEWYLTEASPDLTKGFPAFVKFRDFCPVLVDELNRLMPDHEGPMLNGYYDWFGFFDAQSPISTLELTEITKEEYLERKRRQWFEYDTLPPKSVVDERFALINRNRKSQGRSLLKAPAKSFWNNRYGNADRTFRADYVSKLPKILQRSGTRFFKGVGDINSDGGADMVFFGAVPASPRHYVDDFHDPLFGKPSTFFTEEAIEAFRFGPYAAPSGQQRYRAAATIVYDGLHNLHMFNGDTVGGYSLVQWRGRSYAVSFRTQRLFDWPHSERVTKLGHDAASLAALDDEALAEVRREIIRYELGQVAYYVTPYLRKGLSAETRRKLVEEWKDPATADWGGGYGEDYRLLRKTKPYLPLKFHQPSVFSSCGH